MPGPIDQISQMLGIPYQNGRPAGSPSPQQYQQIGDWYKQQQALAPEARFRQWLQSLGVDEKTLDPEVRMMYYQQWRQQMGASADVWPQTPHPMRGGS